MKRDGSKLESPRKRQNVGSSDDETGLPGAKVSQDQCGDTVREYTNSPLPQTIFGTPSSVTNPPYRSSPLSGEPMKVTDTTIMDLTADSGDDAKVQSSNDDLPSSLVKPRNGQTPARGSTARKSGMFGTPSKLQGKR